MKHRAGLSFAITLAFVSAAIAGADEVQPYMRVVEVDEQTLRLDMAVRHFAPADGKGPSIALVAAIHIADEKFYPLAQLYLDAQDLVLFEGVGHGHDKGDGSPEAKALKTRQHLRATAVMIERYRTGFEEYPPSLAVLLKAVGEQSSVKRDRLARAVVDGWGHRLVYARTESGFTLVSRGADGKAGGAALDADMAFADQPPLTKNEISNKGGIQNDLADALGLTFQLNAFDTGRGNYRNSDMTLAQIETKASAGGGDAGMLLSIMDGSGLMGGLLKMGLAIIRSSPRIQATMKVMMIEMLEQIGNDITKIKSVPPKMKALLKVLIEDRNQIVIDDLKKELAMQGAAGAPKSIAIWYGAGHMKDLEQRLTSQLGYKPVATFWLPALTVDPSASGMSKAELERTRAMLRRMLGP